MKKPNLLALIGYFLLTLLMTWPVAAQFGAAIPGDGFDGWQNYWNQWWIKEALLNRQTHFFFTDILYPPSGVSLLFHTLNFFNGLWTLPIQLNFGLTVAYNAVVLFHFTMSGFGVFLLARYTLAQLGFRDARAAWASFIAGVIFTFSPFHMAHLLGHMQVLSLTWPPFYMLWIFKSLNEWRVSLNANPQAALRRKDLAMSGLFLLLTTTVDWYQTLYMLLFTALLLAWIAWRVWRDKTASIRVLLKPVLGLAAMGLVFGLIFSPLIIPMAAEAATAEYMRPSFEENVILSADLLAFFTPSELHPVWGDVFTPYYQNYTTTTAERLIFAGFIPLALALIAAVRSRRKKLVQFWSLHTVLFFTLALGPYLHIAGNIIKIGNTPLPLPYLLLYKIIPFIGVSRSLSRYDLMVMIGLGLLASVTLTRLKIKWQLAFLILILFEFIAIPYPMSPVDTPDFFHKIAGEAEDYNIAYLPMNWDRPAPLLYQTTHQKGLLTAYTSRNNPLDLSWRTPVLQQWRALSDDIIKTDLAAVAPTVLNDFNIKYIVLDYYQMPPGPEREETERWVSAALPNRPPVYQDDRLTVYQAPPVARPKPYLQLGQGWGNLDSTTGQPVRTMETEATVNIIGGNEDTLSLILETASPDSLRNLSAAAGETPLAIELASNGTIAIVKLPPFAKTVSLRSPNPILINRLEIGQNQF